jgi:pyoverdine/dityrosine biosynthesis protein Dit1/alpha-ketoglutarate-dependent taurine dioxygenase
VEMERNNSDENIKQIDFSKIQKEDSEEQKLEDLTEQIIDVLKQFMLQKDTGDMFDTTGCSQLESLIKTYVSKKELIQFVLPAFPFKSPSSKKVMGILPDFGEYYALFILNSLCETIKTIYQPGASLTIVSDGSIYHDLVGKSEENFRAYQAEIREMGREFPNLDFKCIKDMLTDEEFANWSKDKQAYIETKLVDFDLDNELKKNTNILNLYRSYLIFMEYDLEEQLDKMNISKTQRKEVVRTVARKFIRRGQVFSELVNKTFPNYVRLSIHCHNNSGPKYSICLAPSKFKTPWHHCVVLRNGKLDMMKVSEVSQTARVIMKNGRPWMMVEEDKDLEFPGIDVDWDIILPFGLSLTFKNKISLKSIPQDQLRRLTLKFGVVLIRGVQPEENQESFDSAVSSFGKVQSWFFGNVLTLKYNPKVDINNVLSKEAMPMHYDGLFNLDEEGKSRCPGFQYFYCKYGAGTTLFSDTRMMTDIFKPLKDKKWKVFTPKNNSFGGRPIEIDLFSIHPETKEEIIRYHEPWGQEKTAFKPTDVEILIEEEKKWSQKLTNCLYNRQFCLHHSWKDGDILIADNWSLMHTRLAFDDSERELWRIHLN